MMGNRCIMMGCDGVATGDLHMLCLSLMFSYAFSVVLQISCDMEITFLSSHCGGTVSVLYFMSHALSE